MRNIMKKCFLHIFLCVMLQLIFFTLAACASKNESCDFDNTSYSLDIPETNEEMFAYQIINDEVYIIGLTQLGTELKNIHIPMKIEGKNVVGLKNTTIPVEPPLFDFSYKDESSFICNVNTIVLPSTIRTIDKYFFAKTTANIVKIDGAVGVIPSYAFRKANIKEVIISEGVIEIREGAFNLSNLVKVSFPSSLKSIGERAFLFCNHLEYINFSEGLKNIGKLAFAGCTKLKQLNFPNSLTYIGAYSFAPNDTINTMNLQKIKFGKNLETIDECAFSVNKKLEIVELKNIKNIESGAFYYCSKLRTVIIGENIEMINIRAFQNCRNVNIYCYAKKPPSENLLDVSSYYVLEENYKTWVNSGQVKSNNIKIFNPADLNFNNESEELNEKNNFKTHFYTMIFIIGVIVIVLFKKYPDIIKNLWRKIRSFIQKNF